MDQMTKATSTRASRWVRRRLVAPIVGILTIGLLVGSVTTATADRRADHVMTLTLVRHGESFGNISGFIDTTTPGPHITTTGWEQALAVADKLGDEDFDAVYASTMIRTQETATPLSLDLGEEITVLPGLREIEAGALEGAPNAQSGAYLGAMVKWIGGDLGARIPGGMNGRQFDKRYDAAIKEIYKGGSRNPVAFSHGAAILSWVELNVKNPAPVDFALGHIPNTVVVVVCGSPRSGWKLVGWDGVQFAPACTRAAA